MSSDDILQPLILENWHLLAESLKKNWPSNVQYYYFIQTVRKWKLKDASIPITIYCPNSDYKSGIFIALSTVTYYCLVIFAPEEFEDLLFRAVTETKFINWNKDVCFAAVQSRLIPITYYIVEYLKANKGVEIKWNESGKCLFKPKEECIVFEERIPEDCYLKELDETHVPLIHSVWPLRSTFDEKLTYQHVLKMIQFNKGLGLFSKSTNQLLSWASQSEFGAISFVQTVESCRRRGYAKIVANSLANKLAIEGTDSFVFINDQNHNSEIMFKSWNFKHVQGYSWMGMHKKEL
ncbi:uncharacterized protein LOC122500920 isoform X1 [Leptopilina heterotoma]|uniref:uncharacterized protein LOC122500920 isoform X1 n=1 Tax=Leptopilina heterotoma TaxID=63436 RepID=UPI001CA9080B|nr:uncharacterized protein LOC122500920 isoform X1 [Leptopilina heterotoma]